MSVFVDRCAVCETFFVVESSADLQRRLNAHELEAHGRVSPSRTDHGGSDYR